ncbi:MAG: exodeoxyribonuclease V subunit gamma, partial [Pseudomonadales bacterium]|nr:exodeoxyribonuclease V subunit gamma [Pseudomonadales bacterium]
MIRLFQSNDMSTLMATFVARSLAAPIDPFEPETVVVQSFGMGQWLKLQTAAQVGIAANIRCELPADLVWNLYQRVLGAEVPAGSSPFGRERLAWHLMRELPRLQGERFAPVIHFLSGTGDPQVRTWQLAMKIAGLFDQYLVYRPEWILAWEAGTPKAPDHWLGDLWRQLRSSPGLRDLPHRAALHDRFVRGLETGPPPGVLPERISIFGLSSMPVMHLDAFRAASRHVEVDIYFLNPCQHYWGDVISEKDRERRSVRRLIDKDGSLDDFDYLDVGNPLLSSMGKEGREFMELMLEIDEIDVIDDWVEPPGENILQMIQRDVLNLEFGGEFGLGAQPTPTRVADDDTSLQIHACHSKMREVEVLQDQLYHLMRADPALSPADIIVMTPDVGAYAPYIDAVFRGRMRYAIADRSLREESAVLVAFTSLLALPDSRLASTDMMDLLEVPTIARKLGLFEDELSTITQWIQDAGIRFELDGAAKASRWEIPPEDYNTWQFGLDRLLLGYAMSEGTP